MKRPPCGGPFHVHERDLDFVADRALYFALKILALAFAFLRDAFGLQALISGYLARSLLEVSCDFVAEAFSLVI
jgi:hypothetical protein